MKKPLVRVMIVGALLVFTGFALSGFNARAIEDNIQNINKKDIKEKTADFESANVRNVRVNISNFKVTVKTHTSSDRVTVQYFESDNDKFNVEKTGDTISASRVPGTDPQHILCFFRCIPVGQSMTIYVPADSAYAYELHADNGDVAFMNGEPLQTRSIRITSSNGTVQLGNITTNETIDIRSKNGGIELSSVATTGKLKLESSNSTTALTNVQAATITSDSDNGGTVFDTITARELTAQASNSTITLHRFTAERATLTSDNGSIRGTVAGLKEDYAVHMTSDNGQVRVNGVSHGATYFSERDGQPKTATFEASNGLIDITFEKE